MEFFNLTMHQIKEKLGKKDVKATEILDDVLKRIDDVEDKIGAHITLI